MKKKLNSLRRLFNLVEIFDDINRKFSDINEKFSEINEKVNDLNEKVNGINLSKTEEVINEAAFFSNCAKNGLHYHYDEETIFSKIYTGQIISVLKSDFSLAQHLILSGIWEIELTQKIEEIIPKNKPITIFDVGANFGWYGLVLSRFNSESSIHFFEANPNLTKNLENTILLNGLNFRSKINQLIISSNNDGEKELIVPNKHKGSASVNGDALTSSLKFLKYDDINKSENFKVQTKTLDKYSYENDIKEADFIKIDVEGHEEEVLLGAINIINSSNDLIVLMEWNLANYSNKILSCLDLFNYFYVVSNDS